MIKLNKFIYFTKFDKGKITPSKSA